MRLVSCSLLPAPDFITDLYQFHSLHSTRSLKSWGFLETFRACCCLQGVVKKVFLQRSHYSWLMLARKISPRELQLLMKRKDFSATSHWSLPTRTLTFYGSENYGTFHLMLSSCSESFARKQEWRKFANRMRNFRLLEKFIIHFNHYLMRWDFSTSSASLRK